MPITAPFGLWYSPITAEIITKDATVFTDLVVDPITSNIYHVESRPSEGGRSVVVNTQTGVDVTPGKQWNFRTGVYEYGGAASIVYNDVVYFSNYTDGRVYSVKEGGEPKPITPVSTVDQFAAFTIHPRQPQFIVALFQDNTSQVPSEVINNLCLINTQTKNVHSVVTGANFYSCPKFSPDGSKLVWQQWCFPNMSWQVAEIHIGDVVIDGNSLSIKNDVRIAGGEGKDISCVFPGWRLKNDILFTSDVSRFINPWKYSSGKTEPLLQKPVPQDFGSPAWTLNTFPYAILDTEEKYALFVAIRDGRDELQLVNLETREQPQRIDSPYVVIENIKSVSKEKKVAVFMGTKVDEGTSIVACTVSILGGSVQAEFKVLKSQSAMPFPKNIISTPEPRTIPGRSGGVHVVFYRPKNPAYSGSSIPNERPPCVVGVHGGPTGLQTQGLDWYRQYFTSRGFAWVDVNYSGSSGYGRDYIERLNPNWGCLDPDDCISTAEAISNWQDDPVDPKRIVIRGGSSGGFTVLCALSHSRNLTAFGAGTSLYGISNLENLVKYTHKFESSYMDKLLGGTIKQIPEVYKDRSPLTHANDIKSPLLLLQGGKDKVVPPEQSKEIYDAIIHNGGIAEYKVYPDEGHGWREESTMRDALEREILFYLKCLKIFAV